MRDDVLQLDRDELTGLVDAVGREHVATGRAALADWRLVPGETLAETLKLA